MTSFTNTEKMLIVQIPILFKNKLQKPMNLYKMVTVPVPFDKDTYEEKHNTYTQLKLKEDHIVVTDDNIFLFMATNYRDAINKDLPTTVNCYTLQVTLQSTTAPLQFIFRHQQSKLLRRVDLFTITVMYLNQKY